MNSHERFGRRDREAWQRATLGLKPLRNAGRAGETVRRGEVQASGRPDPAKDEAWIEFTRDVAPLGRRSQTVNPDHGPREDRDTESIPPGPTPAAGGPRHETHAMPGTFSLDRRTRDRLKRGRIVPEARLDLHGLRYVDAKLAATQFIQQSHRQGQRLVLVITGRGTPRLTGSAAVCGGLLNRSESESGVLRRDFPNWVREGALASIVIHCEQAHATHGGHGAFYVYLKKRRQGFP